MNEQDPLRNSLYALYKFLEVLLFESPDSPKQEVCVPSIEIAGQPEYDLVSTREFVQSFPGLMKKSGIRYQLDRGPITHDVGDDGQHYFDAFEMLEQIERTCRSPKVKKLAQKYLAEYYECD